VLEVARKLCPTLQVIMEQLNKVSTNQDEMRNDVTKMSAKQEELKDDPSAGQEELRRHKCHQD
jgi:predicted  nucleic acid-binding Zn-ribbon protein